MGENTKIEWADHTFNPWWGCSKVSAGCKNCYADKLDSRFGGDHWGADAQRKPMSDAHWRKPLKWNLAAAGGARKRVFCASMCDVFEILPASHPSYELLERSRRRLWDLIERTPHLDWLLLTKRPENFAHRIPGFRHPWPNVWLGVTAENQEQADLRIPILLSTPAALRFVSYEPALGPVDFKKHMSGGQEFAYTFDWLIVGAESGPGARPMSEEWVRSARDQCRFYGVDFFYKQKLHASSGQARGRRKISLPTLDGTRHSAVPSVVSEARSFLERPTAEPTDV